MKKIRYIEEWCLEERMIEVIVGTASEIAVLYDLMKKNQDETQISPFCCDDPKFNPNRRYGIRIFREGGWYAFVILGEARVEELEAEFTSDSWDVLEDIEDVKEHLRIGCGGNFSFHFRYD